MRVYLPSVAVAKQFSFMDVGLIMCDHVIDTAGRPTVLDNGAYSAWKNGEDWKETKWLRMLQKCERRKIEWAVVPDVVADRRGTLCAWSRWSYLLRRVYGFAAAFVVQDGMTPDDIPRGSNNIPTGGYDSSIAADIIFVGGTTAWKWSTLRAWTAAFPRVHVGKVNSLKQLLAAHDAGAESIDGTGFSFENKRRALRQYSNAIKTPELFGAT
tara:strand:+ start:316 stop:951 length:636 start_codon:yes stop_codon:yes gene_type:complete